MIDSMMLKAIRLFSFFTLPLLLVAQVTAQVVDKENSKINILGSTSLSELQQMVLLDARDLKVCQSSSVKGAKCLPANTFHSQKGQLASFGDIRWAFGTANLKEVDNVLVFSDKPRDRELLTGLLFLAGQHKITYWTGEVSELQLLLGKAAGQSRGILRTHIYSGIMRDNYIALDNKIKTLQNSGWQLVTTSVPKLNNEKKLLITGPSPITNISTFTKLHSEGQHQLLVKIN